MKRTILFLVVSAFACFSGTVAAQMSPEHKAEFDRRMDGMMKGVAVITGHTRTAMAKCPSQPETFQYPYVSMDQRQPAGPVQRPVIISITGWTGQCVDGKREGKGVLNWTVVQHADSSTTHDQVWQAEGSFVNGERRGLWCIDNFQFLINGKPVGRQQDIKGHCSLLTGNESGTRAVTAYRKAADGRWQLWAAMGPASPPVYLPAGALEAQSEKMLAGGIATQDGLVSVQTQIVDDLVRGSRINVALSDAPLVLKDKRIIIVLSSGTIAELERFRKERAALISSSTGLSGEAAAWRGNFISASEPDRLLVNFAKVMRGVAREVKPADDLAPLDKGEADYAIVLDWKHLSRFDLLGKFDSFPKGSIFDGRDGKSPTLAGETVGGMVIAPGLKAVKLIPGNSNRVGNRADITYKGDFSYFFQLAIFYQGWWGKGLDDPGLSFSIMEAMLKR